MGLGVGRHNLKTFGTTVYGLTHPNDHSGKLERGLLFYEKYLEKNRYTIFEIYLLIRRVYVCFKNGIFVFKNKFFYLKRKKSAVQDCRSRYRCRYAIKI